MPLVAPRKTKPTQEKEHIIQEALLKKLRHQAEETQTQKVANQMGLPYIDLTVSSIDAETVQSIPEKMAREGELAVIHKSGKNLRIGVLNPNNPNTKKVLTRLKEENYSWYLIIISQTSLERAWETYKIVTHTEESDVSDRIVLSQEQLSEFEKGIKDIENLKNRITEIPTTDVFNILIAGAIKTRSTDIHLEPSEQTVRMRYRIDGVLHDITELPIKIYPYVISRLKMIAKMKLNVTEVPQNGRFSITVGDNNLDVRASLLPNNYGESVVLRLLNQKLAPLSLDLLGINDYHLEIIERELSKPTGMVLTTGPTGSGKTTTLYAFLNKVNSSGTKIITIEDPIEYHLKGVAQTQVEVDKGYTFASALTAILRQDPDIIMVGEIRDSDTARTAIQAALTGHTVFSTLHTNNAAGTIPRLIELDVKPTLIAPATNCVIAQRLLRKLCPFCKEEYSPQDNVIESIKKSLASISPKAHAKIPTEIPKLYKSHGCPKCNNIGYYGRLGIYEILTVTPAIEKLISGSTLASEIHRTACEEGMITLTQDGLLKAISGITSIHEIERVTGEFFSIK